MFDGVKQATLNAKLGVLFLGKLIKRLPLRYGAYAYYALDDDSAEGKWALVYGGVPKDYVRAQLTSERKPAQAVRLNQNRKKGHTRIAAGPFTDSTGPRRATEIINLAELGKGEHTIAVTAATKDIAAEQTFRQLPLRTIETPPAELLVMIPYGVSKTLVATLSDAAEIYKHLKSIKDAF